MIKIIWTCCILILLLQFTACSNKQEEQTNRANQYLKSAQQLYDQGQLHAALIQAKNVVQIAPELPQGYVQIAKIYNRIGYYAEVEKLLSEKISSMPALSYELAFSYYQRKKFRSALEVLALSTVDQDQNFRLLKALCHLSLDEMTEFDMELRKIAAYSSDDGYLIFAQAKLAQTQQKWEQAQDLLSQIPASHSLYIEALTDLAENNVQQSRFDLAEKYLTQALSIAKNADTLTVEKARILSTLVQLLVRQGRSGEAYTYQTILASANPELDSMKNRFDDAVKFFAQGDIEKAKLILNDLHQQFPNNSNVTTLLGVIAFQLGQDEEAESYLAQVIDPETTASGLIQASSLVKARNNKIDDAIKLLRESVEAQPKNAQLLATYGLALLQKNPVDKEGAIALEKSVAMDPSQQRLRLALADRHYRLNEREQGLTQLETAFRQSPLDKTITQHYLLQLAHDVSAKTATAAIAKLREEYPGEHQIDLLEAWWMIEQKHYLDAEKKLLSNISSLSSQEKTDVYQLLTELYLKQGKADLAKKVVEDYLRLMPASVYAYGIWFELVGKEQSAQALAFLQELIKADEANWQPYYYSAVLKAKTQDWQDLEKLLDIVVRKTLPITVRQQVMSLYNTYGFQLYKDRDFSKAQSIFLKTLAINSVDRTALYYTVDIALQQDQVVQANKILDQFSEQKATAIYLFLDGMIKEKEQKSDDALKQYKAAWKAEAFDLYAEKLYGIYRAKQDQESIMKLIEEWNQRLPESPQGLLLFALLQQEQNKPEAINTYEQLLLQQPNNLVALNNLSWLYSESNNLDKAKNLAARAYQLAPDSADVMDTYAWILIKDRQYQTAYELLTKALKVAPDNKAIQEHLSFAQKELASE